MFTKKLKEFLQNLKEFSKKNQGSDLDLIKEELKNVLFIFLDMFVKMIAES